MFVALLAFAQIPQSFEVASVKPSASQSAVSIRRSGNRLTTTGTSLQMLITWAYDIHDDRLVNKPKWLDSVRYDITAQGPPGEPAPGALQKMTRALLAERFGLRIHPETRQLPTYAMGVVPSGTKIHPAPAGIPGPNPFDMSTSGRLTGTTVSADMLAKVLANQVGRPVQNETGLEGFFDFVLVWSAATDTDPASPAIFTALQEQLGLKLAPRKGPVEVFVIDRVESTPSNN